MTEQEYLKKKRQLLKEIDDGFLRALHKEISQEEYMQIRQKYTDLIKEAKQQDWFKHI